MIHDNKHWLPEENGNVGKWTRDANVRDDIYKILYRERIRLFKEKRLKNLRENKALLKNI